MCPFTVRSSSLQESANSLCPLIPLSTVFPVAPTMSSLQRRSGLPTDLTPFICHSVLLMVRLLSFTRVICLAHFHFTLVTYSTMPVTPVLCVMMVFRILPFSWHRSIGCSSDDDDNDTKMRNSRFLLAAPPREREVPGSNPASAGIFSGSSHTSDLKIGTPVATLPGAWRYRVSTGTGRPGVSIL